jgi:hypothetical protein
LVTSCFLKTFKLAIPDDDGTVRDKHVVHRLQLASGDLFVLGPESNKLYKHSLVPEPVGTVVQPRLSIIYRHIVTMKTSTFLTSQAKRARQASAKRGEEKKKQIAAKIAPAKGADARGKKKHKEKACTDAE